MSEQSDNKAEDDAYIEAMRARVAAAAPNAKHWAGTVGVPRSKLIDDMMDRIRRARCSARGEPYP